jgi:hypothetical protein
MAFRPRRHRSSQAAEVDALRFTTSLLARAMTRGARL